MGNSGKYEDKSYTYISILITSIYMYNDVVIIIIIHFQTLQNAAFLKVEIRVFMSQFKKKKQFILKCVFILCLYYNIVKANNIII